MTKEQIELHGDVMKWFLSNPDEGVFKKLDLPNAEWLHEIEPEFNVHTQYVQNDEYAEFRKALVDGKAVQLIFKKGYKDEHYKRINTEDGFLYRAEYYRIKPEEPTFQVGDWVVYSSENRKLLVSDVQSSIDNAHCISEYGAESNRNITKWEPEEGEWCVFWDDDWMNEEDESYILGRYENHTKPKGFDESYDNVAPLEFLQTLKDK